MVSLFPNPHSFRIGDWVVFTKTKASPQPGPRARDVAPSPNGDRYTYVVDKYWVVDEILDDDVVRLRTRTGKSHVIPIDHPNLRKASIWERLILRSRFPVVSDERPLLPSA